MSHCTKRHGAECNESSCEVCLPSKIKSVCDLGTVYIYRNDHEIKSKEDTQIFVALDNDKIWTTDFNRTCLGYWSLNQGKGIESWRIYENS